MPLTLFLCYSSAFGAGNIWFKNVLISKTGNTTTVEFLFGCPTRYIDHFPLVETDHLQINLSRLDQCDTGAFENPIREIRMPPGRALAGISEVEYVAKTGIDALLLVRFDFPVRFSVDQRRGLQSLQLFIELPVSDETKEPKSVSSEQPDLPVVRTAPLPDTDAIKQNPERLQQPQEAVTEQISEQNTAPSAPELFAINLMSLADPIMNESIASVAATPDQLAYLTNTTLSGQTWYRLRLGFFPTESAARIAAKTLNSRFPGLWVVRVSEKERDNARKSLARDSSATAPVIAELPAPNIPVIPAVSAVPSVPTESVTTNSPSTESAPVTRRLSEERISELMADAETEQQKANYSRAVQIYTKILAEPEHSFSANAREYLGLARERNKQIAHAVAEYRIYLDLYPNSEGAERVSQRLAGLLTARETPKPSQRNKSKPDKRSHWETYGGISQYYRRNVFDTDNTGKVVNQSSLISDADLMVKWRGDRFDFSGRTTMGYLYDFLGEEGPGNNSRFYNAYVDLQDTQLNLFTRIGRQSLHTSGVLGRFDGLQVGYDWKPDIRFNVTAGYPVDSSADGIQTERSFYGAGIDFTQLKDLFDVSIFYNRQKVDSLTNRQAIGAELRYYDISRSLITAIDYDIDFNVVNSFITLGNWTFDNKITLTASIDVRKSPYLTTRTALIGQPATTIDELLLSFSEADIRQLAEDRAADVKTYSFGFAKPLFERFQINFDVTMTQFGGTPASGGVPESPDFGTQFYYSTNLIGYSLLKEGDSTILGLSYIDGDTSKTSTFSINNRYPISRFFRINPRIIFSMRESNANNSDRWLLRPSLRFLYQLGRHYQLDFVFGGELSETKSTLTSTDTSSYFINLGYRADF
jgi:hypothetical protein